MAKIPDELVGLYSQWEYDRILTLDAEAEGRYQEAMKRHAEKHAKDAEFMRQVKVKQAAYRKEMQKRKIEDVVDKAVKAEGSSSTSEGFQSHVALPQPEPAVDGEGVSGQNTA